MEAEQACVKYYVNFDFSVKKIENRIILIERQYVRYQTLCLITYLCL